MSYDQGNRTIYHTLQEDLHYTNLVLNVIQIRLFFSSFVIIYTTFTNVNILYEQTKRINKIKKNVLHHKNKSKN